MSARLRGSRMSEVPGAGILAKAGRRAPAGNCRRRPAAPTTAAEQRAGSGDVEGCQECQDCQRNGDTCDIYDALDTLWWEVPSATRTWGWGCPWGMAAPGLGCWKGAKRTKKAKQESQRGARRPRARGAFAQYRRQEEQEDQEDQCNGDTSDIYDIVDTLWAVLRSAPGTRGDCRGDRWRAGAGRLEGGQGSAGGECEGGHRRPAEDQGGHAANQGE
jgi:hypothetical protein